MTPLTILLISLSSLAFLFICCVLSFLMFFRRCIAPCFRPNSNNDAERGHQPNSRVSDEPATKGDDNTEAIRKYERKEIEALTANFTTVIGQGGFSTVYLAKLRHAGVMAAVKVQRSSERLHRAFLRELDVLLHVKHPNIVNLLGYSDECEEGILVFEYISNGTLHDKLHGAVTLPWSHRMNILFQVATAVDYLHDGCDLQIVHGDITASNVLLTNSLNAKLCDFGSARMGFSATVQPPSAGPMIGSLGYADPHYLRTGIVSKKSDVYSFGVLVLEMVTGIPAFRSEEEKLLTAEIALGVDQRLGTNFNAEEVILLKDIAAQCIGNKPGLRPSMGEVVRLMKENVPSLISAVDVKLDG